MRCRLRQRRLQRRRLARRPRSNPSRLAANRLLSSSGSGSRRDRHRSSSSTSRRRRFKSRCGRSVASLTAAAVMMMSTVLIDQALPVVRSLPPSFLLMLHCPWRAVVVNYVVCVAVVCAKASLLTCRGCRTDGQGHFWLRWSVSNSRTVSSSSNRNRHREATAAATTAAAVVETTRSSSVHSARTVRTY